MTSGRDTIRVVHVDDDPDLAALTATFLERENSRFDVETVASASEGLEFLADHDVDCIVSDYDMPGRNGIEFLESVRDHDTEVPFLLYTGKGSEEIASGAISAGVTDYLQKEAGTSQYTVLANRISNAVEQYRGRLERQQRSERQAHQSDALLDLIADDAVTAGEFRTALERITETAADVLEVPRVNVWLFDDDGETLRCVEGFDRRTGTHDHGLELVAEHYPVYFEALESSRSIAADDAVTDPRTAELEAYLDEHDIGALLDGTIRSEGDVVGVVCHEHVGRSRSWTDDETEFASDIAELVHRAHRNQERTERAKELERTRARFQALTESTGHVVVTIDIENTIHYVNDSVEDVLGYTSAELTGESLLRIMPERFHESHQAGMARYLQDGTKELCWDWIEFPGLHKDGHEVPLGITIGEATVDGVRRFTALLRDLDDHEPHS